MFHNMQDILAALVAGGGVAVASTGNVVVAEINKALAFTTCSAESRSKFDIVADRLATVLKPFKGTVRIVD
jgi:flagellar motor protein MotB